MPAIEIAMLHNQVRQVLKLAEETNDHLLRQSLLKRASELEAHIAYLKVRAANTVAEPPTGSELEAMLTVLDAPEPEGEDGS